MTVWNYRIEGDDTTRTASVYDNLGALVETRPYTVKENIDADIRAAEAVAANNETTLRETGATEISKIETAVAELAVLLGDNTTPGSIRSWRSSLNNSYDVTTMRNVADLIIKDAQATRLIARETLRLARLVLDQLDSADVGPEV